MNVSATPPYNADFDGDEMNIHVAPQSIETHNELEHIANLNISNNICSSFSKPIITFVQDSVLGAYLLTLPDISIDWRDVMNLLIYCKGINVTNILII